MPAFRTTLPVRFGDIDHAGILYYPRFYHYFHQSFEEIFSERLNIHYSHTLDVDLLGFPAVHHETDFVSPVFYGQTLIFEISCKELGNKSVTLTYKMIDAKTQELRASCLMVLACVDMKAKKAVPFPQKYRDLFLGLKED